MTDPSNGDAQLPAGNQQSRDDTSNSSKAGQVAARPAPSPPPDLKGDENLLSIRSAVILLSALLVACIIGLLAYQDAHDFYASITKAGAAWVAALVLLHQVIIRKN